MNKPKGCAVAYCRAPRADLIYLGQPICSDDWKALADDREKLREALGLNSKKGGSDERGK
jgi:hypothetical protein